MPGYLLVILLKHTHTHPFIGHFSGTTQVSQYQKGKKPIWILLKQVPHHSKFFTGRMPFLPPNQQRQSTEGLLKHTQKLLTYGTVS